MKIYIRIIAFVFVLSFVKNASAQALIDSTAGGGFELGATFAANGWTELQSPPPIPPSTPGEPNQWVLGFGGGSSDGSRGAYISDHPSGLTNTYTGNICYQRFYQQVSFPASQTTIKLYFKWKAMGEFTNAFTCDVLNVYLVPSTFIITYTDPDVYIPYKIGNVNGYYSTNTNWHNEVIDIAGANAGQTMKLVFSWINNFGEPVVVQPPAALDNIALISFAPPANNECGGAFSLPMGALCTYTTGTTALANQSPDAPPSCATTDVDDDVWYSFVADNDRMKISVQGGAGFNAGFAIYDGTCGTLNQKACVNNNNTSGGLETIVLGGLTVNQTYFIRVYSIGTAVPTPTNSNFQICLNYPPPPITNDDCTTAQLITAEATCTNTLGTTLGAFGSVAIASPPCQTGGTNDDVWFKFVATQPVLVTQVQGLPGFDPVVAVYSGCALADYLNCKANTTPGGTVALTVSSFTVGETYYARVYSAVGTTPPSSDFNICVFDGPQHDECFGSIDLSIGATCTYTNGSTQYASQSPQGNPTCSIVGSTDDDVWYSFIAGASGVFIDVKATSAAFDPAFAVYSGADCNSLTEIACSSETGVNDSESKILGALSLVNGDRYYIRVFGSGTAVIANPVFQICLSVPPPPPANDECLGAIAINTNQTCSYTPGTTRFSSASPQVAPSCATTLTASLNDDVWYSFVADKTVLVVKVQGQDNFNPAYAVYSGTCAGGLTEVTCVNANAILGGLENKTITSYTIGETYFVRVYSAQTTFPSSLTSNFQICVNWGPQNDECAGAFNVPVGVVCTNTIGTTFESTQSAQSAPTCAASGINDDVWYSFVPTDTTRMEVNVTGGAGFDAAFAFYSGNCGALNEIACVNDAGAGLLETRIFGSLISTLTYYVRVYSVATALPTAPSSFSVCIEFPPPPPTNDECVNATLLPTGIACTYTNGTTLFSSQSQQPAPSCGLTSYDDDVWYKFVADSSRIKINVQGGTDFNPMFAVYKGSCNSFTKIMCNNATSNGELETTILYDLKKDSIYYIRVFGLGTAFNPNPNFQICATYAPAAPVNDDCFNAINLTTSATCNPITGNTYGATPNIDYPEPACGANAADDDVWYKFVADRNVLQLKVQGLVGFDPVVAVYSGNSCANLTFTPICLNATVSSEAETITLTSLTLTHTYFIRVFGAGNSSAALNTNSGFNLCLSHIQSTECAGANPFCSSDEYSFPASTNSPPVEPGPDYGCLGSQPNPVWYWMKIKEPGTLTIYMETDPPKDIDFITWGPFTDQFAACPPGTTPPTPGLLTGDCVDDHDCNGNIVDCSFSGSVTETATIPDAQVGQYYLFLLTNYSNQPTQITFSQTNEGTTGAGETDCAIICPMPTAITTYNYCKNTTPTQLVANGVNLKWYSQAIGGTSVTVAPTPTTTATGVQNFWVTQTTDNCESDRLKISVVVTDKPSGATIVVTSGNCKGTNAAKIQVTSVLNGAAPFIYSFNEAPFTTSNSISGLATDNNYSVEVKDVAGCTYLTTVSVSSFPGPTSFTLSKTDAACGSLDGSVSVSNVIDGTSPYLYSFNGGGAFASNTSISGIGPGNYAVVVKDQNACTYTANIGVSNSGGPTDVDITITNSTCGQANGKIELSNVQGSVNTPFSYSFNTAAFSTNTTITGIASGLAAYAVRVKDASNCIYTENFTFTNFEGPKVTSFTKHQSTCGNANGSITVTAVDGGVPIYQYSFNGGVYTTSQTFTGLSALSVYSLKVKDSNGCEKDSIFQIPNAAGPTTYSATVYGSPCQQPIGKIFINSIIGGTAPYSYNFNGVGYTTNTIITGIAAGTYTFNVKDANGCQILSSLTVPSINGPSASTYTVQQAYCNTNNGKINVTSVSGGIPPYSYSFNGSTYSTNFSISGLAPTSTTVDNALTIKDSNGCEFDTTYRIGVQVYPSAQISGGGIICNNSGNSVQMSVNLVGYAPWTIAYTDGTTITTVTSIGASPYTFTSNNSANYTLVNVTTEQDNCRSTVVSGVASVVVKPVPDAPLVSKYRYCLDKDILKLTVIDNIVGATYNWYSDEARTLLVATSTENTVLPGGIVSPGLYNYYVTQTVSGCTSPASVLDVSAEQVTANFTVTPDYGEKPLLVGTTNLTTGATVYTWDFGNSIESDLKDPTTTYDKDGTYTIVLTASNDINCIDTASATVVVEPNYLVEIPNVFSPNGDGKNEELTIKYIGVKSVEGYIYNRWGKKVYEITSVNDQWNGKIKGDGSDAPDGVYYLLLNVTPLFGEIKEYNFSITIIR